MEGQYYDRASRYLAKLDPVGMLSWFMNLATDAFRFRAWLDTRRIPFPGEAERINDTVAHVEDLTRNQLPWALVLEFQAEPDPLMFGRMLIYEGQVWLELKPSDLPGDRFHIAAVIVNLTGGGDSSRSMEWPEVGACTILKPVEINLAGRDAEKTLTEIEAGKVSRVALPFVALMKKGSDPAIIQRWLTIASSEPDAQRRGAYGRLVVIFAEAAGSQPAWAQALRGWNVKEPQIVLDWIAGGKAEGMAEGLATAILRLLELRFRTVPPDLSEAILATTDLDLLQNWVDAAYSVTSLEEFRRLLHPAEPKPKKRRNGGSKTKRSRNGS